jgi:16S rRNA (cytidine1402-2'-O)-methyltransferase
VAGRLLVIATPLGNLGDVSPRALEELRRASCIACEDTRRTQKLLARHDIAAPLVSYHKFNERRRLPELIARIESGADIALVTDGGTPAVSDPGAAIVRAALEAGAAVIPIPGPSAVTAALSISGFASDRFVFDGFLPARAAERRRRLRELVGEPRTLVVFEAPHRIVATLVDVAEIFGERPLVAARELTKLHETVLRGTASEVARALGPTPRGELTLVLAGAGDEPRANETSGTERLREAWRAALESTGGDRRLALRQASRALGLSRAELQRALDEVEPRARRPR